MVRELKYDDDGCRVIHGEMVPSSSSFRMMGSQIWTEFRSSSRSKLSRNLNIVAKKRHMLIVLSRDFNV